MQAAEEGYVPELPEAETMVRELRPALVGRTIRTVRILDAFLLKNSSPRQYRRRVEGRYVHGVHRHGKWILLDHDGGLWTLIQPRMTGGFRIGLRHRPPHARLCWELDRPPHSVWYTDLRRLGVLLLLEADALQRLLAERHGPDALTIDARTLRRRLARCRSPIKAALMKQELIAGLGNIYAEEALHVAGIRPDRPADTLQPDELRRLARAIRSVLRRAIAAQGTSFRDYRTARGSEGEFQRLLNVYHRTGQPCRRCGAAIQRMKMSGLINRYTHFCPRCQR